MAGYEDSRRRKNPLPLFSFSLGPREIAELGDRAKMGRNHRCSLPSPFSLFFFPFFYDDTPRKKWKHAKKKDSISAIPLFPPFFPPK